MLGKVFCITEKYAIFRVTPILLAATALAYRTDEIIQSLEP
jgi:hypothetical protein